MHSTLTVIAVVLMAQLDRPQGDHPNVFVTAADLVRVKQAAATETGALWADQLIEKAQSDQLSDLPALDRSGHWLISPSSSSIMTLA